MPRPNYSNIVSITTNATNSELVLNFNHTYPIVNEAGETIKAETECVSSIVMSREMALRLRDLITRIAEPAE